MGYIVGRDFRKLFGVGFFEQRLFVARIPTTHSAFGDHTRFRIPGDVIARTCENLPDDQRTLIKWAAGYCRAKQLTTDEFGALLRQPGSDKPYTGDSVYQAFTGRREAGSLDRFCESIETFRNRIEESSPRSASAFIETSQTKIVWKLCSDALKRNRISFLFGPSQVGKSLSLTEYQRAHNHGETIYVRMPTGGSLCDFLNELAIRLDIPHYITAQQLRRRIIESFDTRTLLQVDEAHQTLLGRYTDRAQKTLEFIRELWDRRKCGLVICGTDVLRKGLKTSPLLGQLWLRRYQVKELVRIPPPSDLAAITRAFGLEPPSDRNITIDVNLPDAAGNLVSTRITRNPLKLQQQILETESLGRWITLLQETAENAHDNAAKLTWTRVIAIHAATDN